MATFNERLRGLRKENNLTQRQVFSAIEMSERNYQSLEYGKIKPSFETLDKLVDYFDVSTDYLLGKTDDSKTAIAVAVPEKLHKILFAELKRLGVSDGQIKRSSPRARVIGEGFIVDGLKPSEAGAIAKAIETTVNNYIHSQ